MILSTVSALLAGVRKRNHASFRKFLRFYEIELTKLEYFVTLIEAALCYLASGFFSCGTVEMTGITQNYNPFVQPYLEKYPGIAKL